MKTTAPGFLVDGHREIRRELAQAVEAGGKTGEAERNLGTIATLSHRLIHHARLEEEILYPAAVPVGEYLKLADLV